LGPPPPRGGGGQVERGGGGGQVESSMRLIHRSRSQPQSSLRRRLVQRNGNIYWNVRAHARVYVPSLSHTKTITVTEIPLFFCGMVVNGTHKTFFELLIPMREFCGILALITTPPQLWNVIAYMAAV
jgi:hypothetical protein